MDQTRQQWESVFSKVDFYTIDVLSVRLTGFRFRSTPNVTVKTAWIQYQHYTFSFSLYSDPIVPLVVTVVDTVWLQISQTNHSEFTNPTPGIDTNMLRATMYVTVETPLTPSRNVVCSYELLTDFISIYKFKRVNANLRSNERYKNSEVWWDIASGNIGYWVRNDNANTKAIRFKNADAFVPVPGSTYKAGDAAYATAAGATQWIPSPMVWGNAGPANWGLYNVKNTNRNERKMAIVAITTYSNNAVFTGYKTWLQKLLPRSCPPWPRDRQHIFKTVKTYTHNLDVRAYSNPKIHIRKQNKIYPDDVS
jgi:hypothetical protein